MGSQSLMNSIMIPVALAGTMNRGQNLLAHEFGKCKTGTCVCALPAELPVVKAALN